MSALEPPLVPRLRGVLHAICAWIAAVAAVVLVALAPSTSARVAALIYGLGLVALFAVSGLYHRWRWDPRWQPLLRRLDHSTIHLFIAASATPIALLVLDGAFQAIVLVLAWTAAVAGVVLSVAWVTAPRWVTAAAYLTAGWAGAAGLPQLLERLPPAAFVLLVAGGVLYTVGAVVYARQRPDPWPRTFGFHEIFHALVVLAAAAHFAAMAGWIVPSG